MKPSAVLSKLREEIFGFVGTINQGRFLAFILVVLFYFSNRGFVYY